jgi:hypothetical protein
MAAPVTAILYSVSFFVRDMYRRFWPNLQGGLSSLSVQTGRISLLESPKLFRAIANRFSRSFDWSTSSIPAFYLEQHQFFRWLTTDLLSGKNYSIWMRVT